MIIHLNEVPNDGRTWSLNRANSKLGEVLHDVIHKSAFQIHFSILPLSDTGTFQIQGTIKTELPEECSRCGLDFQFALDEKFKNILVPGVGSERDAQFAKPNHFSDLQETDLEVAEFFGDEFNAGEFLHELIALAQPQIPAPPLDAQGSCRTCKIDVINHSFSHVEEVEVKSSPFAKLKGIKLN